MGWRSGGNLCNVIMECFVPRETTGLEPHSCAYLFTQQVQTIRVAEIFFGVKHLQEEGNSGVTDIAEVAPQGCSAIHVPCCQGGASSSPGTGREETL